MSKKFLRGIGELIIYVIIIGGIVWGVPSFLSWKLGTNYPIAAITSGSMWPVLKTGDLVLIKAVSKDDLKIGDIIVWRNPNGNGFTIHRIKELRDTALVTKGDANFSEDNPVPYSDVIGRNLSWGSGSPVRIPFLGYISMLGASIKKTYANN